MKRWRSLALRRKSSRQSPGLNLGGEKRRAALAGIIAMKPKYLVLDEPMAGLDALGRKAILDTIDNLRARHWAARCLWCPILWMIWRTGRSA